MTDISIPEAQRDYLDSRVGVPMYCEYCKGPRNIKSWSAKWSIHGHVKFYFFRLSCHHEVLKEGFINPS